MRIGILTHNYPKTSGERIDAGAFIFGFAQELAKSADVFVLCPDFPGNKEKYTNVPVTWFKWNGGEKLGSWSVFNPLSLIRFTNLIFRGRVEAVEFAKRNKLDFLLACWTMPSGVYGEYVKQHTGIPYATWSLGSDLNIYAKYPILGTMIKSSLKNADVRFANSYLLVDKIEKMVGLGAQFLPAITDFDIKGIKPTKLEKGKFNFLFIGRLERVKGPDILVEACQILKKERSDFVLRVVGVGGMQERLKGRVGSLGLADHVFFLGQLNKRELASLILSSDSLVISSRSESLPLVLIEAARAGLPVIATEVGDCPRLIKDYNLGFVAEKENPEEFAKVMEKALEMGVSFKNERRVDLLRLASQFSQKRTVGKFLKMLSGGSA